MRIELYLPGPDATKALGARLAPRLKVGDMICLHGGLGAGKTTLTRGLVSALVGQPTEVPSPTYTLIQTYETPRGDVWHYDLYRLEDEAHALEELGWDEAASAIALVEWPCRAGAQLPPFRLDIHLDTDPSGGRRAALEPKGEDWQERLHGF